MLVTEMYDGQGLGNQLWCYAVTRTLATDRGQSFGIQHPERFKGYFFSDIDFGLPSGHILNYYKEKMILHPIHKCDISPLDKHMLCLNDTKIEGVMQAEGYIKHRKSEICKWFEIKREKNILDFCSENICIIHFRGGDFNHPQVLLKPAYYDHAIQEMKKVNPNLHFCVVTDDLKRAKEYFPTCEIIGSTVYGLHEPKRAQHHLGGDISVDYSILHNARYLILSNSSFGWWAAWTNQNVAKVIAPMYWARHNISDGFWSTGDILTEGWEYMDRDGFLQSYEECLKRKA